MKSTLSKAVKNIYGFFISIYKKIIYNFTPVKAFTFTSKKTVSFDKQSAYRIIFSNYDNGKA
ncbi:hypothetical protein DM790_06790 [Flavobacterium collinsii]|nr:hypothetical protein [Flavobacterium collinsii]